MACLLVVDALRAPHELVVGADLRRGVEGRQAYRRPIAALGVPVVIRGDRNELPDVDSKPVPKGLQR